MTKAARLHLAGWSLHGNRGGAERHSASGTTKRPFPGRAMVTQVLSLVVLALTITSLLAPPRAHAADRRRKHHGAVVEPFQDAGVTRYYVTWSSSAATPYEHDIYRAIVHFDTGVLQIDDGPTRFIGNGTDEAQEPVSASVAESAGGVVLTAWEDGSGPTIDVHAQLHLPNGTVIVPNWIVAGGPDSQHSAATSHVGTTFLVAYADETPLSPGEVGAVVKLKALDDQTGAEVATLDMTAHADDNWWPVTTDDGINHAFVGWGDGNSFFGAIVTAQGGSLSVTPSRTYVAEMRQYHYQVVWLEQLQHFLIVVRNRRRGSSVCLIDTQGAPTRCQTVKARLVREAKPAAKWDPAAQAYKIVYPTGSRHLAILRVNASAITEIGKMRIPRTPELRRVRWTKTGTWGTFVTDLNGQDIWNGSNIALFVTNDKHSDDPVLAPIPIAAGP